MGNFSKQDTRIATTFAQLLSLQAKASGFSFLPHHNAASRLSGQYQSKFRGRGLNFEEFRHYRSGDDIRNLDWRVTLRTGQPHVRVYSEEKDLQVILCVDQRQSMFFSSIDTMKSVVAAELAALSAWRIQKDNDRVGSLVFNDQSHLWFTPQRNRDHALRVLRGINSFNQRLSRFAAGAERVKAETSLATILKQLTCLKPSNTLIVFYSDFKGLNDSNAEYLKQLQAHNDLMAVMISDNMELDLNLTSDFYASDGQLQIALPKNDKGFQAAFESVAKKHIEQVSRLFNRQGIPLVEVGTSGLHIKAFIEQISGVVYAKSK